MTFKLSKDKLSGMYFVTARIVGGKCIFYNKKYLNIILNSLNWFIENKKIKLFAFVIMPNHFHLLLITTKENSIYSICHSLESFTAHEILRIAKQNNHYNLIKYFNLQAENFKDRSHKIWQDIQAKNCYSEDFVRQKLEYIHNNPVAKKWNLVKYRNNYKYSSAGYYDSDLKQKSILKVEYLWNYFFGV